MSSYGLNTRWLVIPSYVDSPNICVECFQSITQGAIWNFPLGPSWCLKSFGFGPCSCTPVARRQGQALIFEVNWSVYLASSRAVRVT